MPLPLECPASAVEEQATVSVSNDTNSAIAFIMCVFIESGIRGYLGAVHFFYYGGILSSPRSFSHHGPLPFPKNRFGKKLLCDRHENFFFFLYHATMVSTILDCAVTTQKKRPYTITA